MRHQPENHDWTVPAAAEHGSGRPKPDPQKETAKARVGDVSSQDQAVPSPDSGKKASYKRKLEELNDREDLSERLFSDRNLL